MTKRLHFRPTDKNRDISEIIVPKEWESFVFYSKELNEIGTIIKSEDDSFYRKADTILFSHKSFPYPEIEYGFVRGYKPKTEPDAHVLTVEEMTKVVNHIEEEDLDISFSDDLECLIAMYRFLTENKLNLWIY